jgi:DNA polymerase III delta prime subunit
MYKKMAGQCGAFKAKADFDATAKQNNDAPSKDLRRSKRRKTDHASIVDEILMSSFQFYGLSIDDGPTEESLNSTTSKASDVLWTYKYQFCDENDIVTNKSQILQFKQWLEQLQATKDNKTKSRENGQSDDSDYSYDSESSTTSSVSSSTSAQYKPYSNAIILNGPTGCGKTSSVYCIAKKLNCKVFEVNTSNVRCKSQIIQDLVGVLSSHHVVSNTKDHDSIKHTKLNKHNNRLKPITNKIDGFFVKRQINASVDTNPRKRRQEANTPLGINSQIGAADFKAADLKLTKNSLILFDDIDVVLKDDKDFWSVISFFVKKSKKPIVLTCNDEFISQKLNLNIDEIKYERPSYGYSLNYLKAICLCEGLCVHNDYLETLLKSVNFDLRRAILQLQVHATSLTDNDHNKSSTSTYQKKTDVDIKCLDEYTAFLDTYMCCDRLADKQTANLMTKQRHTKSHKYDYFMHKDGIVDELSYKHHDNRRVFDTDTYFKEYMGSMYGFNSFLFDCKYACMNKPILNWVLNKYACKHFKFTSDSSLYVDYGPYLKSICKLEQSKQLQNNANTNKTRRQAN